MSASPSPDGAIQSTGQRSANEIRCAHALQRFGHQQDYADRVEFRGVIFGSASRQRSTREMKDMHQRQTRRWTSQASGAAPVPSRWGATAKSGKRQLTSHHRESAHMPEPLCGGQTHEGCSSLGGNLRIIRRVHLRPGRSTSSSGTYRMRIEHQRLRALEGLNNGAPSPSSLACRFFCHHAMAEGVTRSLVLDRVPRASPPGARRRLSVHVSGEFDVAAAANLLAAEVPVAVTAPSQ